MGIIRDRGRDGAIKQAIAAGQIGPTDVEPLKELMKQADGNGDGKITNSEWVAFKKRLMPSEKANYGPARYFHFVDRHMRSSSLETQISWREDQDRGVLPGGWRKGDRASIVSGENERITGTIVGGKDGLIYWVSDRSEKREVMLIAPGALFRE